MRIAILTSCNEHEDNRLLEAAKARGHNVKILELLRCSLSVCMNAPEVYYDGEPISNDFDLIIPRIDTPHTEYGLIVLKQFAAMHIFISDNPRALQLGRDKLRCVQRLLREGVPFPSTGFAHSSEDYDNIIQTVGGVPLIIKLVEGTEGVGVFLADDMKHAINLLKTFQQLSVPLIVQKFIEESAGTDIRVFVVGDEIVACMQRQSQDGDFRANVALGGDTQSVILSEQEQDIALRAARAININVAGVDIIRSNDGPLVIEINVAPGFTGLEEVTGIDVAGKIIEFAVNARENWKAKPRPLTNM
tara:strand:- start:11092 stop:12003 length:912 start_codon:yes stop_codon:yes gene_type:complete